MSNREVADQCFIARNTVAGICAMSTETHIESRAQLPTLSPLTRRRRGLNNRPSNELAVIEAKNGM
jgi:hypothetical protein